ncbi:hypothetical protein BLA29_010742, partial [Euroglyphus maynei]
MTNIGNLTGSLLKNDSSSTYPDPVAASALNASLQALTESGLSPFLANFPFPSTLDLIGSASHLNDLPKNKTSSNNNCGSSSSQTLISNGIIPSFTNNNENNNGRQHSPNSSINTDIVINDCTTTAQLSSKNRRKSNRPSLSLSSHEASFSDLDDVDDDDF